MAVTTVLFVALLMCDETFGGQTSPPVDAADDTTTFGVDGRLRVTTKNVVVNVVAVGETDDPLASSRARARGIDGSESSPTWTSSSQYDDATVRQEESSTFDNESGTEQPLDDPQYVDGFWQYQRGLAILRYGLPVLLAFTTIDNALAVIVLQHPTFRGSPTCFVLSALAVTDMLVVYTGLMRQWVISMFNFDFRLMSESSCKFHVALTYFSRQVWTVVVYWIALAHY